MSINRLGDIELPPLKTVQVPYINDGDLDPHDIKKLAVWCASAATDYARAAVDAVLERLRQQGPAAYMYPSDLEKFQADGWPEHAYPVPVTRSGENSIPLYRDPLPPAETLAGSKSEYERVFNMGRAMGHQESKVAAALRELVRLKDVKASIETADEFGDGYRALVEDYQYGKPKAWAAARAVIAELDGAEK